VAADWYGLWGLAGNSTIFVAPEGLGQGWANTSGQDVAFTDAILAQLKTDLCIDESRIFANGFSYGGGMSYAIACARAEVFRGVVVYSGGLLSGCSGGTTPIAFYASHGTGESGLPPSQGCTGLRDHFVEVNGCTRQAPPDPPAGSGAHRCTTYDGCSTGHPVTYCAFDGGHMWNPIDRGQAQGWNPTESWKFITQF
jgi:poly(3-hydroxybutyrate) depolymerase